MRRTDSVWLPLDAGSELFAGLGKPAAHLPQAEQPAAPNLHGDCGESYWLHWENAWIDLGGEG